MSAILKVENLNVTLRHRRVSKKLVEDVSFEVHPGECLEMCIRDSGYTIYHAGDLNNWRWNGEDLAWNNNMSTNYRRELEKIKASGFHPDVAMVPLDGRQEDLFYLGLDDFMRTVGAEMVFPMHFWEDFSVIPALKKLDCSAEYRDRVADIRKDGQRFCFPAFPDKDVYKRQV